MDGEIQEVPQKRTKSQNGRRSRTKGRTFEQWLVRKFKEVFTDYNVKRGWQARSGEDAADVVVPLFWIEAKVGKQPNPRAALKQAINDAPAHKTPLAIIKDDRCDPFVVMQLEDFLSFVEEWWHNNNS